MPHPPVGARPCSRLKKTQSLVECKEHNNNNRRTHQWTFRQLLELHHHPALFASPSKVPKNQNCIKTTKRNSNGTHLLLETQPLLKGIIQLRIGIAELFSTHETFKSFTKSRARTMPFSKRGHDLRMAHYKDTCLLVILLLLNEIWLTDKWGRDAERFDKFSDELVKKKL